MSKSLCESCINLSSVTIHGRVKPCCTALYVVFSAGIKSLKSCESYEQKLTRKEAVNLMGIGYTTLYSWIAQGLPVVKEGNRVYFREADLKNYKPRKVGRPRSVNK